MFVESWPRRGVNALHTSACRRAPARFDLATIVAALVPLMREVLSDRQVMAQLTRLSGNIGLGFVALVRSAKWLRIREF